MKIGFIGAGKVGKALGLYFESHGLMISGYYSRTEKSSKIAAELTSSKQFTMVEDVADASDIMFITASDQALEALDRSISALIKNQRISSEKTWLHVSGAHPSGCLAEIKAAGCAVGSMHPLESFGEPLSSAERLNNAWFTIEGTEKGVQAARMILEQTGGKYSLIEAGNKPLYHAGACVVSNFLVTLMESGIRFFEAAGMNRDNIIQAIVPLIDATLSNIRERGTIDALTGPIVRGDFNTVGVHLQAAETLLPSELDFYKAMAAKTVGMIEDKRLTHEQAEKFREVLEEKAHV